MRQRHSLQIRDMTGIFGARPLKRAIQKYLEDELAELMLTLNADGKFGGTIEVTHNEGDDKLTIKYEDIV